MRVDKIFVGFGAYDERDIRITGECYRCRHVNDVCCFKCSYCMGRHSDLKVTLTCSECLNTRQDTHVEE